MIRIMRKSIILYILLIVVLFTPFMSCSNSTPMNTGIDTQSPTTSATISFPPSNDNQGTGMYLSWWLGSPIIKPGTVSVGEQIEIWADLYISDMVAGFINAYLMVNNEIVSHHRFLMLPDELTAFNFTYIFDKPGVYSISIRTYLEAEENPVYGLSNPEGFLASYAEITIEA